MRPIDRIWRVIAASRLAAMPGRLQMTLLAGVCALTLGACGSDEAGTIPKENSSSLVATLDAIQGEVDAGNCELAGESAQAFVDGVNLLPAEVDDEVKQGLQDAANQLRKLTADPTQCEDQQSGTTGAGGAEPTEQETSTSTSSTTTPPTTEAPPEEEQPSEEESDGGDTSGQSPEPAPETEQPSGEGGGSGDDDAESGGIGPG